MSNVRHLGRTLCGVKLSRGREFARKARREPIRGQIVGLYDVLARADPSPVIVLNWAAAVAMRDGPLPGLALIDAILARGDLADYHLAHAARAHLCRRLGRTAEARESYERALGLARQEPERRFLQRRIDGLPD